MDILSLRNTWLNDMPQPVAFVMDNRSVSLAG
jgi:hypothetical protein